ncbi:CHASE3 domain-containing protein [Rhizobium sp. TH2]|uniref:sensor histidine kinase n=1 Tax=Rhizobium sp. TH2 TaxID=2775403 RepID=UPI0021587A9A|nr:ATP-binding protein [Rhizobium sp. TH2]UVC09753.1 CHASE3 domain-containing protein [Rhizobium sp. TH2]
MTTSKTNFIRSTVIALAAGALLLIAIIGSTLYLVYQTQSYAEGAITSRRVRSTAADLLLTVQKAETSQRGYLLTSDMTFIDSYRQASADMISKELIFEEAISSNPFIKVDLPQFQKLVTSKVSELQQTIELSESGRRDEAMDVVRSGLGRTQMSEIESVLQGVIDAGDARIADQVAAQVRMAGILRVVTICGAISIASLLIGVVLIISRYVKEIQNAQAELGEMNSSLEGRVHERTEDLMQANQEIQRYAYIVTHDLRAPLVNIMGFTAELDGALNAIRSYFKTEDGDQGNVSDDVRNQARLAVEEDLPEAIGFIRSSTRKMDGLINAILKISRDGRRQLQPEPVDLGAVVRTSGEAVQHQIDEADGALEISVNVKDLISDRFSIEQVIGNLFDNAVKYREPSRPLELSVKAFAINRFKIGIDISDNGRGIAPEDHERVFELFRRSGSQDKSGEGIGLAHVRSLVRNMGGEIKVKSELGKGTTFMIRLPHDLSQFVRSTGQ